MNHQERQFVIQQHTTAEGIHWDLMLEVDDCLWTWRLNVHPDKIGIEPVTAERIHDHPLRFLNYEGPIQNNTACVIITDKGIYTLQEQTKTLLVLRIKGEVLTGTFKLWELDEKNHWKLKQI